MPPPVLPARAMNNLQFVISFLFEMIDCKLRFVLFEATKGVVPSLAVFWMKKVFSGDGKALEIFSDFFSFIQINFTSALAVRLVILKFCFVESSAVTAPAVTSANHEAEFSDSYFWNCEMFSLKESSCARAGWAAEQLPSLDFFGPFCIKAKRT